MTIIEDTRQKQGEHEYKHQYFSAAGLDVIRCKLPFGDYSMPPSVAVDTKANMDEICTNICSTKEEHKRFIRECKAAQEAGCHLYFLIENFCGITCLSDVHNWINPRIIYSPKAATGIRLERAMRTIQERYGCTFLFCTPDDAGKAVMAILKRGE